MREGRQGAERTGDGRHDGPRRWGRWGRRAGGLPTGHRAARPNPCGRPTRRV